MFAGKHDGMYKTIVIGIPIDSIAICRLRRTINSSSEKLHYLKRERKSVCACARIPLTMINLLEVGIPHSPFESDP